MVQKAYIKRDEEKQRQKAKIMLSTIEQMTQIKWVYGPTDSKLPKEDARKGNTLEDNQRRKGEINVPNVVMRGISRENAKTAKRRSR
jgi:hypothetical protein